MLTYRCYDEEFRVVPVLAKYYEGGRTSLSFRDAEDGSPILTATINLLKYPIPGEDYAFIKNWSENEGVLDWLLERGMVSLVAGIRENVPTGRVMATLVKLNVGVIRGFQQ